MFGRRLRYAAAFVTDKPSSAYALLFLGSVCIGIAQPNVQIIGPAFSETWFTPRGRTTVTMLIAVANPFGAAVGDLVAPAIVPDAPKGDEVRTLLLVMGIATTVAAASTALVRPRPPTPPSLTAGRKRETLWEACRAMMGARSSTRTEHLTKRHRIDFAIIVFVGGVFIAFFDAYSVRRSSARASASPKLTPRYRLS